MSDTIFGHNIEFGSDHNPFHNFVTVDGRLTEDGNKLVGFAFEVLAKACFVNSYNHGWYEKFMVGKELGQRNFGEVIALITSELSEAYEAHREGDDQTRIHYSTSTGTLTEQYVSENPKHGAKPEGIASEFADAIIRIMDYAGAYGVPIGQVLVEKHAYNVTRPFRHGGKLA